MQEQPHSSLPRNLNSLWQQVPNAAVLLLPFSWCCTRLSKQSGGRPATFRTLLTMWWILLPVKLYYVSRPERKEKPDFPLSLLFYCYPSCLKFPSQSRAVWIVLLSLHSRWCWLWGGKLACWKLYTYFIYEVQWSAPLPVGESRCQIGWGH